ncbi:hypothetical protein BFG57_06175 [Bacillus solimangrovi]|uniref:Chemotaxis protein n=2 Tax=Bacillus solimangrovi TaxID=1305675 RepID=A0A1E5LAV3_9BACI|nr:methyl-accepting chemotaxis protein [Bacillus solimangrovi]OEH91201.1 hypothetical protein BFG57_06175 [Bacillus solimangrovi]
MLKNKKVGFKIALFFIIVSLLSAGSYLLTTTFLAKQETDATVINLAGRQRMLSQKMSKEAIELSNMQNNQKRVELQTTMELFDQSLTNLMNGSTSEGIPVAPKSVLQQLNIVNELWQPFKKNVEAVIQSKGNNDEALQVIISSNVELLTEMNKAVGLLEQEANDKVANLKLGLLFSMFVLMLTCLAAWFVLNRHITKPIKDVSFVANQVALGKLDIEKLSVKNEDEIGQLSLSINQMLDNLQGLIKKIKSTSESLTMSATDLNGSISETTVAAEHLTHIAEETSEGADEQLRCVNESIEVINELTQRINQISTSSQEMSRLSSISTNNVEQGGSAIESVVTQMGEIHNSVDNIGGFIDTLRGQSKEIGNISLMITDIAEQTNLLALNASIEAARAGEHGKGFAVVASEIHKLASQSKQSADQISHMITDIQNETGKINTYMVEGKEKVDSGMKTTSIVSETFDHVKATIHLLVNQVSNVTNSVEMITENSKQIVTSIKKVKEIAIKEASASHEGSAATEQELAAMEEMKASADMLETIGNELQTLLQKFKI